MESRKFDLSVKYVREDKFGLIFLSMARQHDLAASFVNSIKLEREFKNEFSK